jgi:hypothetical protein
MEEKTEALSVGTGTLRTIIKEAPNSQRGGVWGAYSGDPRCLIWPPTRDKKNRKKEVVDYPHQGSFLFISKAVNPLHIRLS